MAFCSKCGSSVNDGERFCPNCGSQRGREQAQQQYQQASQAQQPKSGIGAKFSEFNNTADSTAQFHPNDIAQNKGIACLSYLGPLVFIPLFAKKDSPYAQYHAQQGVVMFAVWAAYVIVEILLSFIRIPAPGWRGLAGYTVNPWWVTLIIALLGLAVSILALIGFINALQGKAKELPLIGKIKLMK